MKTQTKASQDAIKPADAIQLLKEGNLRFGQSERATRDLNAQVSETSEGQYPFAAVLSCIDSRVPAEMIFDQGIGDIFSARVAGNVINKDILGSLEYSCKVAGSKAIVVLGHTKCGAVTAACKDVELGNITHLLEKIKPAVNSVREGDEEMSSEAIEEVTLKNVDVSIEQIKNESPILKEMLDNNEIDIVGAVYSVATGRVTFL